MPRNKYEKDDRIYYDPHYGLKDSYGFPLGYRAIHDAKWVDPTKTKEKGPQHPYDYSEYFIFGNREVIKGDGVGADYSDRLQQWNYGKYEEACRIVNGRFTEMTPAKASKFLTTYFEKPKTCVALAEGCNASSGYPYFIFWYKNAPSAEPVEQPSATE